MAPYLGHKAALKILSPTKRATVFEEIPLLTRPYYYGRPWFLPIASAYFRAYDLFDYYRRQRSLKKIYFSNNNFHIVLIYSIFHL